MLIDWENVKAAYKRGQEREAEHGQVSLRLADQPTEATNERIRGDIKALQKAVDRCHDDTLYMLECWLA